MYQRGRTPCRAFHVSLELSRGALVFGPALTVKGIR
jgi:hypothetical protein